MARRRMGGKRSSIIAFDLNKMSHEIRMIILQEGNGIIGELANAIANEARHLAPALPAGEIPRGPNKRGSDPKAGPLKDGIFCQPSDRIPAAWVVCSPVWYSHLVEYGTLPHDMPAPNTKKLKKIGKPYPIIHHPGARQHPFLRPAADKAEQFLQAILNKRHS